MTTDASDDPLANRSQRTTTTELLHRQVNPTMLEESGRVVSSAFEPKKSDGNELSISCGLMRTAMEAFWFATRQLSLSSAGVWAVTVGEVEGVGEASGGPMAAWHDPIIGSGGRPDDDAHGIIDFNSLPTRGRRKAAAKLLRNHATERGCLARAE